MIYIDRPRSYLGKQKKYSHLMADTLDELHKFSESIGLKRCWFDKDHYDISEDRFDSAIQAGAKLVSSKKLALVRKNLFTRR